jgi:hypothetical protein
MGSFSVSRFGLEVDTCVERYKAIKSGGQNPAKKAIAGKKQL